VYHVELRHFPHNMCRFNLDEAALRPIVEAWVRGQEFEFGERTWSPQQARITILEEPQLPLGQLTMGRGWRVAEREGTDVTERVLAAVRQRLATAGAQVAYVPAVASTAAVEPETAVDAQAGLPPPQAPSAPASLGDPFTLGMQLAALLGPEPMRLLDAWRAATTAAPGLKPSETLARAEQSLAPSEENCG
jgi:hypothetical protein